MLIKLQSRKPAKCKRPSHSATDYSFLFAINECHLTYGTYNSSSVEIRTTPLPATLQALSLSGRCHRQKEPAWRLSDTTVRHNGLANDMAIISDSGVSCFRQYKELPCRTHNSCEIKINLSTK